MRNVKCKNKNVLEVLKSSKYISLFEPRQSKKKIIEPPKHLYMPEITNPVCVYCLLSLPSLILLVLNTGYLGKLWEQVLQKKKEKKKKEEKYAREVCFQFVF